MQTCSNELRWALADNEKSPVSELRTGSFSDLAQLVTNHAVSPHKEGPAWLPANIQPGRRSSEKAGSWGVLALDVERKKDFTDPAPPVLDVAKTADMWGMSAAIATSYSHAMHDPRYRVVLEVNRPILTHEIERLARVVAGLLGVSDHLDTGCFDPARLFYLPRVAAIVPPGAVVFIDTLNRATPGCDENSSKDMGMILEAVNRLQSLTGAHYCPQRDKRDTTL